MSSKVSLLHSGDSHTSSLELHWHRTVYTGKVEGKPNLDSGAVQFRGEEYRLTVNHKIRKNKNQVNYTKDTKCDVCWEEDEEGGTKGAEGRIYEVPPASTCVRQSEVPIHVLVKPHRPDKVHSSLEYPELEQAVQNFHPETGDSELQDKVLSGKASFLEMQLLAWRFSGPVDLPDAKKLPKFVTIASMKYTAKSGSETFYTCSSRLSQDCGGCGMLTRNPDNPEEGYFCLTVHHSHKPLPLKNTDGINETNLKPQDFPSVLDPLTPEFAAAAAAAAAERAASRAARAAARAAAGETSEQQPLAKATRGTRGTKRAAAARGASKAKKPALESQDSDGEAEPAAAARGKRLEPATAARGSKRGRGDSRGHVPRTKKTRQSSRDAEESSEEEEYVPADDVPSVSGAACSWPSRLRGRTTGAQRYQEAEVSDLEPEPPGSPEQKKPRSSRATSMRRGHPEGKENRAPPTSTHQSRPGSEGEMAALLEQVEQALGAQGQQQAGDEEEELVPGPSTKTEPRRAALPSAADLNSQDLPTRKPPVRRGGGVDEDEEMEEEPARAAAQACTKKPPGEFVDNTGYLERVDLSSLLAGCGDGSGLTTTSSKPTATVTATARSVEDAPVVTAGASSQQAAGSVEHAVVERILPHLKGAQNVFLAPAAQNAPQNQQAHAAPEEASQSSQGAVTGCRGSGASTQERARELQSGPSVRESRVHQAEHRSRSGVRASDKENRAPAEKGVLRVPPSQRAPSVAEETAHPDAAQWHHPESSTTRTHPGKSGELESEELVQSESDSDSEVERRRALLRKLLEEEELRRLRKKNKRGPGAHSQKPRNRVLENLNPSSSLNHPATSPPHTTPNVSPQDGEEDPKRQQRAELHDSGSKRKRGALQDEYGVEQLSGEEEQGGMERTAASGWAAAAWGHRSRAAAHTKSTREQRGGSKTDATEPGSARGETGACAGEPGTSGIGSAGLKQLHHPAAGDGADRVPDSDKPPPHARQRRVAFEDEDSESDMENRQSTGSKLNPERPRARKRALEENSSSDSENQPPRQKKRARFSSQPIKKARNDQPWTDKTWGEAMHADRDSVPYEKRRAKQQQYIHYWKEEKKRDQRRMASKQPAQQRTPERSAPPQRRPQSEPRVRNPSVLGILRAQTDAVRAQTDAWHDVFREQNKILAEESKKNDTSKRRESHSDSSDDDNNAHDEGRAQKRDRQIPLNPRLRERRTSSTSDLDNLELLAKLTELRAPEPGTSSDGNSTEPKDFDGSVSDLPSGAANTNMQSHANVWGARQGPSGAAGQPGTVGFMPPAYQAQGMQGSMPSNVWGYPQGPSGAAGQPGTMGYMPAAYQPPGVQATIHWGYLQGPSGAAGQPGTVGYMPAAYQPPGMQATHHWGYPQGPSGAAGQPNSMPPAYQASSFNMGPAGQSGFQSQMYRQPSDPFNMAPSFSGDRGGFSSGGSQGASMGGGQETPLATGFTLNMPSSGSGQGAAMSGGQQAPPDVRTATKNTTSAPGQSLANTEIKEWRYRVHQNKVCIEGCVADLVPPRGNNDVAQKENVGGVNFLRLNMYLYKIVKPNAAELANLNLGNRVDVHTAADGLYVEVRGVAMVELGPVKSQDIVKFLGKNWRYVGNELVRF